MTTTTDDRTRTTTVKRTPPVDKIAEPPIYDSIDKLLKAEAIGDDSRVYRVSRDGKSVYVVSKSPGQAALAVCEVDRLTLQEINAAYRRVFGPGKNERAIPGLEAE